MKNNLLKHVFTLGLMSSFLLGGCATLENVTDRINPFGNDNEKGQGDVAGADQRISLLSLDEQLQVTGEITPDQIALPPAYVNTDWPQVGGNLAHVMQHTGASGPLNKAWSRGVGKGSSRKGRVLAQPVVSGNRIFVMDADNRVAAYDIAGGEKIWDHKITVELKGKTREGRASLVERITNPTQALTDRGGSDTESVGGGVAVYGDKIIATSGLGVVEALDINTGEALWRKRTISPMHSAPAVSDGRIFAVTDDNELMAFNANTGDVLWTYQGIIESARMLTAPVPAVVDDVVISPFASGEVVALRVQNGGVLWQDALSAAGRLTPLSSLNDIAAGPVVADGFVIVSAQSGVMTAMDLRTGQRIWNQPAGSLSFPLVVGDFVYTATTDSQIVCMSKLNGSVVWMQQLQSFKNEKKRKDRIAWSGPIIAGDRLVTVSSQGKVVQLNPYTGGIISESDVGGSVFIPPLIANETVFVLNDDAKLIALR